MTIEINKIDNFENIDKVVQSNIKNNFFLDANWLGIVSEVFELDNIYLEIKYHNEIFYFFAHKQKNILFAPFIGYGGIINHSNLSDDELMEIFFKIESFTGCKIERVKLFPDIISDGKDISKNTHFTTILEIMDSELEQDKKYKKVIRNSINYAKRKGTQVVAIKRDKIDDFYAIYTSTMKRVESSYITPKKLFEKMCNIENSIFLGAYIDDLLIAGSIFMVSDSTIFYWWNASSDKGRGLCANYLLIDHAIKLARIKGVKYLDMASSNNDRIERGKLLWGGKKIPFSYFDFS